MEKSKSYNSFKDRLYSNLEAELSGGTNDALQGHFMSRIYHEFKSFLYFYINKSNILKY